MGRYRKVKGYVSCQEDDMFWPGGAVPIEVCSWFSFCEILKTYCSNIFIRFQYNATGGECTAFRNAFHYRDMRKKSDQSSMDEEEEDYDDLTELIGTVAQDATAPVAPLFKDGDVVVDMAKSFLGDECIEQEKILEATGNHSHQGKNINVIVRRYPTR
jgi:hypothetical protein